MTPNRGDDSASLSPLTERRVMGNESRELSPAEFASTLSNRFLHCRELGHTWKPHTVTWDPKAKAYDRRLRCSSCHTIRIQVLDRTGHVLVNRYDYPDHYLAHQAGQSGRFAGARDVFRLEAITRFLGESLVAEAS